MIEAKLDKGRGAVATVLVQRGTLRVGDIFVAGAEWGRVRALIDDNGAPVKEAGPSMPVEVLGFQGAPAAGDRFVGRRERSAGARGHRLSPASEARQAAGPDDRRPRLARADDEPAADGGVSKIFPLVIKGDVQGSVEAIVGALESSRTDEVAVRRHPFAASAASPNPT